MAGNRQASKISLLRVIFWSGLIGLILAVLLALVNLEPTLGPAALTATASPTLTATASPTPSPTATCRSDCWGCGCCCGEAAAEAASETAAANPTPTLIPNGLERGSGQVSENMEGLEKRVLKPSLDLLRPVGLALVVGLVFWLLLQLWTWLFGLSLVFEPISNATGDEQLDKVLSGMSFKARQQLLKDAQYLQRVLAKEAPRILNFKPEGDTYFNEITGKADTKLADIITAAKDFAPASIKSLLGLVGNLFPQRGVRVSAILTWQQKHPPRRAIELEMIDTREHFEPILQTIAEPDPAKACQAPAEPAGAGELSAPQAGQLLPAGQALRKAGLFSDASGLFQEVLKIDKNNQPAAEALAECLAASKVQGNAQAAYALGDKLVEAGLLDQAAERYADGAPLPRRAEALEAWGTALRETAGPAEKAAASYRLAGITREVFLATNAVKLYKAAAGAGHAQAQGDLATWYAQDANELATAAENLLEVGRYAGARGYLDQALAKAPDSPRARAALAKLSQLSPHGELEQHAQDVQLAEFYLKTGKLEKAREHAEKALAALPANPKVQALLQKITAEESGGIDRYASLIPLAARFVTLEVMNRELLHDIAEKTWSSGSIESMGSESALDEAQKKEAEGRVEYLTGVLYENYLRNSPHEFYYTQAVDHLKKAAGLWQSAWRPHYALGDVRTYAARKGVCQEEPTKAYRRAYEAYQVADAMVSQEDFVEKHTPRLGLARMLMRRKGPGDFKEACEVMKDVLDENQAKVALKKPPTFVYNLACWLSLACAELKQSQNQSDQDLLPETYRRARYLLVAFLLRDPEKRYWEYIELDDDLDFVRGDLAVVKRELQVNLGSYTVSQDTTPEEFDRLVRVLTYKVGYSLILS